MVAWDEDRILALADAFQTAALEGQGWYGALEALAEATGSQTGELIGLGSDAAVPFNLMTNIDPGFLTAFAAEGGGDPRINPYVRAGVAAPVLRVLADPDFMSAEDYRRDAWYHDFLLPWDVPHICLTTLERRDATVIGLAVGRSRANGPIGDEQRAVFTALAPHVRVAVRTQMALENQGARLLSRAFEGLSMIAFVCDGRGRVQAMTPAAEDLVGANGPLQLRQGRLEAGGKDDTAALSKAIDAAVLGITVPGSPAASTVVLRGKASPAALVLEVVRLPRLAHEFTFTPRVLVVGRTQQATRTQRMQTLAQAVYGLTSAEAEVAARIAAGQSPEEIAAVRAVAVGTIRAQLKTVMSKCGVRRQAELVGRLAQL